MTCTRLGAGGPLRARAAVAGRVVRVGSLQPLAQQTTVEADRERAVAKQRVVEIAQREGAAQPRLLVGAELEQKDLAEQVRQLVRRRVRVAPDLGPRVRGLEGRLVDEEACR